MKNSNPDPNPILAASITKAASQQTYYTIRLLVDRNLLADAYRAYAYFRWVDDSLDSATGSQSDHLAFIGRQKSLTESCYRGAFSLSVNANEQMLVDLVRQDGEKDSGLQFYLRNMMAVMDFDARRRGRLVSQKELESHIKFERTYSPPFWHNRYNLVKGATHGLSHTLTQLAYFRPHNRHPHYHNLYFVGASTHPGTGLPTALVSARLVSERILDDLRAE